MTKLGDFGIEGGLFGDGNRARSFRHDVPAAIAVLFHIDIDTRNVTCPTIGLRQQHAVDDQRRHVAMRVAHQDHIDALHLASDGDCRIFVRHLRRIRCSGAQVFLDAHVHRDHDDIDFLLLAQNGHPLLCFADGLFEFETFIVRHVFPVGNARSRQSQHADPHAISFLDDVRLVVSRRGAFVVGVCRQPGKLCFAARLL